MLPRAPLSMSVLVAASAACGAPRPIAPPEMHAAVTPSASTPRPAAPVPIVTPARWVGATVDAAFSRAMFGTTLYFAADGTRWAGFARPADPVEIGLAPEPIVAAFARDGALVMIGASSAAYLARSPLGPVVERKPPVRAGAVFAGRAAAFAIDAGELSRFDDFARGWSRVPLALDGRLVTQVASNGDGTVVALASPQRLFVSTDDGARFDRLEAPLAARTLELRGGTIALEGLERRASLPNAQPLHSATFALTGDPPHFELTFVPFPGRRTPTRAQLPTGLAHAAAGPRGAFLDDRWLELVSADRAARLLARPLDGTRTAQLLTAFPRCEAPLLATSSPSTIVVACRDGARTRLLRSDDRGTRFVEVEIVDAPLAALAVHGDDVVVARCADASPTCRPTLSRLHAGAPVPIANGDALDAIGRITFDARGVGFVVGVRGRDVVLARLDDRALGSTTPLLDLDPREVASAQLGVVDDHTATIAGRTRTGWSLLAARGAVVERIALPARVDGVALAGRRALAWTSHRTAWESDDGGARWSSVEAPPLGGEGVCGTHGCVFDAWTTRLGWSLPSAQTAVVSPTRARRTRSARALLCKSSGAPTSLGHAAAPFDVERDVDLDGGVRVARLVRDEARIVSIASARANGITRTKLLDAPTVSSLSALGAAAARYERDAKSKQLQTTIAWWSPRGGVASTKYATDRFPELVGAATTGAWAYEARKHVRLVSATGSTRLLPYEGSPSAIARVDADMKAPRLFATDGRFAYAADAIDDGLLGAWPSASSLPEARVHALGGATAPFALAIAASATTPATTFFLSMPGHDPSEATLVRGPTALDVVDSSRACSAGAAGLRLVLPSTVGARRLVRIEPSAGEPASGRALASSDLVARIDARGNACASAIVAEERGVQAIVPPGDLAHAWLFVEDRGALTARPLACAWSDEPLPASLKDVDGFYEESFAP